MDSTGHPFLQSSRLVRRLSELDVVKPQESQEPFSERLGQLFDLSGTVILMDILATLASQPFSATQPSLSAVNDLFFKGREDLVCAIIKGFEPGIVQRRGKFPTPEEYHQHCLFTGVYSGKKPDSPKNYGSAYEPFREFYIAQQGKLAARIYHLRAQVAEAVSGLTPELARLVSLDKGFGTVLAARSRQIFEVVPKLLGQRFCTLLETHWSKLSDAPTEKDMARWMGAGGWIEGFCGEMRELLLAEVEIRLQPVVGLIEALSESLMNGATPKEGGDHNCG